MEPEDTTRFSKILFTNWLVFPCTSQGEFDISSKVTKGFIQPTLQSSTFKVIDTCLKRKSDSGTTLQQLLWNVTKLSHLCNYTCNLSIPLRAISFPSLTYSADRSSSMIKVWKPRQFKHLVPRLKYVARHTSTTHIG